MATIRTEEPRDAVARQVSMANDGLYRLAIRIFARLSGHCRQRKLRMQQASEDEFNRALNIAFDNRLG